MEEENEKKDVTEKSSESDREENVDFLRYVQETQKFPLEMESLKTSIESNRSTVRLAEESISHFAETRSDSRATLWATLGVSVLTLIILIVQTFSNNQTEIVKPIELKSEQVQQILEAQEKNNIILTSQIDSMKFELKKVNKALILVNRKK